MYDTQKVMEQKRTLSVEMEESSKIILSSIIDVGIRLNKIHERLYGISENASKSSAPMASAPSTMAVGFVTNIMEMLGQIESGLCNIKSTLSKLEEF